MSKYIKITERDNVAVALESLKKGEEILGITLNEDVPAGHKFALADIAEGENVIKYAFPIGHATKVIAKGDWVHTHNVKTNLSGLLEYTYNPHECNVPVDREATFEGYVREDGRVGIRNEVWIVNTVGCVNGTSKMLEKLAQEAYGDRVEGVHCFVHPYGCSQLGEDHKNTQKLLASMVKHPNAGAVLVLSLGCENNNVNEFKNVLGEYNPDRVKFLITQDHEDEIEEGMKLLDELTAYASQFKRETVSASELVIGLKCGGSDGLSGITANPLLGAASDLLARHGGTTLLTEVPEMFGAETILMDRCKDEATFHKAVALINDFKAYFIRYNQEVYENPSPGNKAGGITTLEDKSLGCTQKGGTAEVRDVLKYCEPVKEKGLNLVQGPGNDICAITALMGSGAQMVLFTTGRGTPVGAPIPTVKVATNTPLAEKKHGWIDFNAGVLVQGATMEETSEAFFKELLAIASGKQTKSEMHDYREIAIFKDGVTL
ncbi:MAG: altronate dehydratase [Clostridia bacterium]|nr:altronate dehydratase [Clostridia bacterium]